MVSLSCRTIVFKGMLLTTQLDQYFPDLHNPAVETALALVHSRFSTNTFPSWDRAHPYRYIAHNGEINTVRGNSNWMHAREARFEAELFGEDIRKIAPIINPNGSDSGMLDNTLELLYLAGRSLPHAMMMMIPGAVVRPPEHGRRQAGVLPVPLEPDGALGRSRPPSRSPTAGRSARCSTATACGRRATTSPTTTSWSWPPRRACSTCRRRASCRRAGCSRAACSSWTPSRAASSTTRRSSGRSPSSGRIASGWTST